MKTFNIRFTGIEGTRLDKFLAEKIPTLSRTQVRKLIDRGGVHINRKRCRIASRPLVKGARVEVFMEALGDHPAEIAPAYEFSVERIVHEDEDLFVANKPPGLPAQSTVDITRDNLYTALQNFLCKRDNIEPEKLYFAIHHRLDRDTSGIMLFTKTQKRNKEITDAFRDRTAKKQYLAVVHGIPAEKKFTVDKRISEKTISPGVFGIVAKGGHSASTEFEVLAEGNFAGDPIALLLARPKTGRTHQIRVHLKSMGHPILGDKPYGSTTKTVKRSLLHGYKLEIIDKIFAAPVPDDFREIFPNIDQLLADE